MKKTLLRSLTVGSFEWSPDGKNIAFDHRVNSSPASSGSADISIVTVADATVRKLVTQDGPDSHPVWSPDGSRIAFETSMANPAYFRPRIRRSIPASRCACRCRTRTSCIGGCWTTRSRRS